MIWQEEVSAEALFVSASRAECAASSWQPLTQCAERRRGLRCSELPAKIRSRKIPLGSAALLAFHVTDVVLLLSACASLCSRNGFVGMVSPGLPLPQSSVGLDCSGNTDGRDVWQREKEPGCPCRALVAVSSPCCSDGPCFGSENPPEMEQGCGWMSWIPLNPAPVS